MGRLLDQGYLAASMLRWELCGPATMRVLSLDLDFFLHAIRLGTDGVRPPAGDFPPWAETDVRHFCETQLGLSVARAVPGIVATGHQEAFLWWRDLVDRRALPTPFDLVHVDAHADLGIGDAGFMEIMTELLHLPPGERPHRVTQLEEGNFLAYAIACRWISSVEYVTHPKWSGRDLHFYHFRNWDDHTRVIEMKAMVKGPFTAALDSYRDYRLTPLALEPAVPFRTTPGVTYRNTEPFDLAFVCQSPGYAPVEADGLLEVLRGYVRERVF